MLEQTEAGQSTKIIMTNFRLGCNFTTAPAFPHMIAPERAEKASYDGTASIIHRYDFSKCIFRILHAMNMDLPFDLHAKQGPYSSPNPRVNAPRGESLQLCDINVMS